MSDDRKLHDTVEVPAWVVIYAIRYGIGRLSYAHQDAHMLWTNHGHLFPPHIQAQMSADFAEGCRRHDCWKSS